MAEDYKIELGIGLKDGDFTDIKKKIDSLGDNPIKLKIDAETKELTNTIKEALNTLSKGTKNVLTVDTSKIEKSLDNLSSVIGGIRQSLGTLEGKGMTDLVTSINQMAKALGKAENESDSLVKSLSALSKKDFSVNIGFNMGKSASQKASEQGDIKRDAISQLKQQAKALEDYFDQYYKVAQQGAGVAKLTQGTKFFSDYWEMSPNIGDTKNSLKQQVSIYKQYVELMQEAAKLRGIDISGVTSSFSKTTSEIEKEVRDASSGVKETEEQFAKIKNLLGSSVDGEKLSAQLHDIVINLREIKDTLKSLSSGISVEGLTQSFDKLSDTIDRLVQNATQVKSVLGDGTSNAGMSNQAKAAQETANAYQEVAKEAKKLDNISIDISNGNIDDLRNALKNLKVNDTSIEEMINKLNEMSIVAKNVSGTLKNGELVKWDVKGVQSMEDGLERVATLTTTIGKNGATTSEKFSQSFDKIADAAKNIQSKLRDTGFDGFKQEVKRVKTAVESLDGSYNDLNTSVKQLDAAMDAINSADQTDDIKRLVAANEEYENALKQVYSQLKLNQQTERLMNTKANLSSDMENWLKENTRAAKDFGDEIRKLQTSLNGLDADSVKRVSQQFNFIKKQAKSFGKTGLTVFDQLKNKIKEYSVYFSAAEMFMYAEQALRSMFEQVKLIDSAMTELKKVTDETDASYNKFLTNAASRSKEIGTTIDGLVKSTADFARLGYGFEDAQGLAEVANIYAVVGDEIEGVEGATESLISTMAAFKNEMNGMSNTDFAMSIIDKFNEIGNNFAISSGGIGEALERSASSLMAANNTIDESIALITAANTVVQDPTQVGTAFKTISMRIRGAKTELEEAGLETEGMVESTAKLRSEILALSGVDIMENANEFKSTYKIMDELAQKWEDLSDIQQATVTELIAGKFFCQNAQKCA